MQAPWNIVHENLEVFTIRNKTEYVCMPGQKEQEEESPYKLHILNGPTILPRIGIYTIDRLTYSLKITKMYIQHTERM